MKFTSLTVDELETLIDEVAAAGYTMTTHPDATQAHRCGLCKWMLESGETYPQSSRYKNILRSAWLACRKYSNMPLCNAHYKRITAILYLFKSLFKSEQDMLATQEGVTT